VGFGRLRVLPNPMPPCLFDGTPNCAGIHSGYLHPFPSHRSSRQ
jgi:hypothetical protein